MQILKLGIQSILSTNAAKVLTLVKVNYGIIKAINFQWSVSLFVLVCFETS